MPRQNSLRRPVRVAGWLPRPSLFAVLAALVLVAACSSPTAPTPPPEPPLPPPVVVDPPSITCPPSVGDTAASDAGGSIIFGEPQVDKGAAPVTLACTHSSGSSFPIGVTTVECTATDAMNRTATCSFQVELTPSPKIAMTRFMAFGDSITAGEVTEPIGSANSLGAFLFTKQVVVPSASYPTMLQRSLTSRYLAQASSIQVINEGLPGETAPHAVPRFQAAFGRYGPQVVLSAVWVQRRQWPWRGQRRGGGGQHDGVGGKEPGRARVHCDAHSGQAWIAPDSRSVSPELQRSDAAVLRAEKAPSWWICFRRSA